MPLPDSQLDLLLTCAFGLEKVVGYELKALGYEHEVLQPGRLLVQADAAAICRLNLNLRVAERVLIRMSSFRATDFDDYFDGIKAIPWHEWIPADGSFPVRGKSQKSQLASVPANQGVAKKAIVEQLREAHGAAELPETGTSYPIEVSVIRNQVSVALDTTGVGLHKRGYRQGMGAAPLRETMAAALVLISGWRSEFPLIDPFCGTGTIPIEAAMIGRKIAPGKNRTFAAEAWNAVAPALWQAAREEAVAQELPHLPQPLLGTDNDRRALGNARIHAEKAGVAAEIHFQQLEFSETSSSREYGCLITNPPYGQRLGRDEAQELHQLYRSIPDVLRRLPTWSHYLLTAYPEFEKIVGQKADRRRKLYNGRIECQYYQFFGPRPSKQRAAAPPAETAAAEPATAPNRATLQRGPAFGGLDEGAARQAEDFRNRLMKRARHLRRWPGRGITCYRLYERDVPDVPLVVDRYEDWLHMAEFARPHERTVAQHNAWLELMRKTAAEALGVDLEKTIFKTRERQRGTNQYERLASTGHEILVGERDLKFLVNLVDYLDTGLFLDHRNTRQMVREHATGKRVLNLFAYTGSFTVYAAAGGAKATTTVDLSNTYLDWALRNLEENDLMDSHHQFVKSDAMQFLRSLPTEEQFDLAVVDAPTFSNSKSLENDWEVQRDHAQLLNLLIPHMSPTGSIYFSNNFRRFKLSDEIVGCSAREITQQTIPEDFRNQRIHSSFLLRLGESKPRPTG
jgi:23S rRNA (guanine2445-N2)-methyltransferase / 23S rRNA (guanine2069-N7)-methyltransferase